MKPVVRGLFLVLFGLAGCTRTLVVAERRDAGAVVETDVPPPSFGEASTDSSVDATDENPIIDDPPEDAAAGDEDAGDLDAGNEAGEAG